MAFCAWCGNFVDEVSYAPCPRCGNPSNGAPRAAGAGGAKTAATIIAVLVGGLGAVAVIGILAAIAIPNMMTAMQRAKQKRTMADMRSVATALEAYGTDKNEYPQARTLDELSSALAPTYVREVPRLDGWETELRYECWGEEKCTNYALGAAGADKLWENESLQQYTPETKTGDFDCDIVFANGNFVQYPEGVQVR